MKLSISAVLLVSAILDPTSHTVEAYPSPTSSPLLLRRQEEAIIAREKALLRPVWRPSTPTLPTPASAPLRRGRRADVDKAAYRNQIHVRNDPSTITAVPIHIHYNAVDLTNMPFPLAMQARRPHRQVKRDASQSETDADEEENWDCAEYEAEQHAQVADLEPSSSLHESVSQQSSTAQEDPSFVPASSSSSMLSEVSSATESDEPDDDAGVQPTSTTTTTSSSNDNADNNRINDNDSHSHSNTHGTDKSSSLSSVSSAASEGNPKIKTGGKKTKAKAKAKGSSTSVPSSSLPSSPSSSSSSGETPSTPQESSPIRNTTAERPVSDKPINLLPGSLAEEDGCTRFHTVLQGEVCLGIIDYSKDIGLTLDQLYAYNPTINKDCTNLAIGQTVCIGKK